MIDILIATYNNSDFILVQLESLLRQTYTRFRIIIRDDCSTDITQELIEKFSQLHPGIITFLKGDKNLGPKGNFAELMNHSQAEYILFCDADDYWLPTKVEDSLRVMIENEKRHGKQTPLLIHTDLKVVDSSLSVIHPSFWNYSKIKPESAHSLHRLLVQNSITGCTMMINKPLLELVKSIPNEAIMHDWWIGLVACALGKIDFINHATVLYRQHSKNCVGAKHAGGLGYYRNHLKKIFRKEGRAGFRNRLQKTFQQAEQFYCRYKDHLTEEQQDLVQSYASLGKIKSALKKRSIFLSRRFFKQSLAKNVGMFFLL